MANALEEIARALTSATRVLLTMHEGPDGDALGSSLGLALALRAAGKEAVVLCAAPPPESLRFLPGSATVVTALARDARFDATVACDSGDPSRLPKALPPPERRGVFINLDHHLTTPDFADLNLNDPTAAAVGVLVHRVLGKMELRIPADAASALFVSLQTDTGSFRYGNTNPEVLRVAAELVEAGAKPGELASAIWESNSLPRLKLLEKILPTLEVVLGGRAAIMEVSAKATAEAGTSEETADGFVSYPRSIAGVEVAVLLREQSRNWRVSLRSHGIVDVARIALKFGGGGHAAAAGCTLVGSREDVRQTLLAAIAAAL